MSETFEFKDIKFIEHDGCIRAVFLKNYYFDMPRPSLDKIGRFELENGAITFEGKARTFPKMIDKGFLDLRNMITKRKTVYIHSMSGIPLIGSSYFGIVDRNTNLIEIRPNTGCNLNCIYCSVNEGFGDSIGVDYVVEKDYLVAELKKFIAAKEDDDIEIHINPQGEPLLYAPIAELVKDVASIDSVKRISMDTNGVLLTKKLVDELISAGLTQFNVSIDALSKDRGNMIAGCNYPAERIMDTLRYIAQIGNLVIAPIYIPGINDAELERLISFAKEINARLAIQNFLNYKNGRNPVESMPMDEFYSMLQSLEKKHGLKLIYTAQDFKIHKTKPLLPVFRKDEMIRFEASFPGRHENEVLAALKGRVVQIRKMLLSSKNKAKIIRTKHNIYSAVAL